MISNEATICYDLIVNLLFDFRLQLAVRSDLILISLLFQDLFVRFVSALELSGLIECTAMKLDIAVWGSRGAFNALLIVLFINIDEFIKLLLQGESVKH